MISLPHRHCARVGTNATSSQSLASRMDGFLRPSSTSPQQRNPSPPSRGPPGERYSSSTDPSGDPLQRYPSPSGQVATGSVSKPPKHFFGAPGTQPSSITNRSSSQTHSHVSPRDRNRINAIEVTIRDVQMPANPEDSRMGIGFDFRNFVVNQTGTHVRFQNKEIRTDCCG